MDGFLRVGHIFYISNVRFLFLISNRYFRHWISYTGHGKSDICRCLDVGYHIRLPISVLDRYLYWTDICIGHRSSSVILSQMVSHTLAVHGGLFLTLPKAAASSKSELKN